MKQRILNHLLVGLGLAFVIGFTVQSSPLAAQMSCMRDVDCGKGSFCEFAAGVCPNPDSGTKGSCVAIPENCTQQYDPVCGCDGKTYGNDCTRRMAGVSLKATSACPGKSSNQVGETCGGIGVLSARPEKAASTRGASATSPKANIAPPEQRMDPLAWGILSLSERNDPLELRSILLNPRSIPLELRNTPGYQRSGPLEHRSIPLI